jgi:hypothetical protein
MINTRYTAEESLNEIRLRMLYNPANTLSENRLLANQHFTDTSENSDCIVIMDWASPDRKYVILLDELYDLESKEKLGDIWENFDNFKLFMSHSFNVATNIPQQIKENVNNTIKSLILTESTNRDISKLKPLLKQLLREYSFSEFGSDLWNTGASAVDFVDKKIYQPAKTAVVNTGKYLKKNVVDPVITGMVNIKDFWVDSAKKFGQDIADMAKAGWEGLKKLGIAISELDFTKILQLISDGVLYVARKIRSLMYNPVGIVLDSILVITGIGKAVQWIPWAFIVGLDIYEVVTGNYEEKDMPTWLRFLLIGCDVLGLVFAGGVGAAARAVFKVFRGARTMADFAKLAKSAPQAVKFIKQIAGALSSVPRLLSHAVKYLKNTKFAKGSTFLSGILSKTDSFLSNMAKSLSELSEAAGKGSIQNAKVIAKIPKTPIKQKIKTGLKAGAKTGAVVTVVDRGVHKGIEMYTGKSEKELKDLAKKVEERKKFMFDFKKETGEDIEEYLSHAFD